MFFLRKKDMANKTIGAIMIREIIRLKSEKFSNSHLARALNLSRPTVIKYVKQIEGSGVFMIISFF